MERETYVRVIRRRGSGHLVGDPNAPPHLSVWYQVCSNGEGTNYMFQDTESMLRWIECMSSIEREADRVQEVLDSPPPLRTISGKRWIQSTASSMQHKTWRGTLAQNGSRLLSITTTTTCIESYRAATSIPLVHPSPRSHLPAMDSLPHLRQILNDQATTSTHSSLDHSLHTSTFLSIYISTTAR